MECLNEKYLFKIKIGNLDHEDRTVEFIFNSNKSRDELDKYLQNFCIKYDFDLKSCLVQKRYGEYFYLREKELLLLWNLGFPEIKYWFGKIDELYKEEVALTPEEISDLIIWMICFENDDVKIKKKEIPELIGYFGDALR